MSFRRILPLIMALGLMLTSPLAGLAQQPVQPAAPQAPAQPLNRAGVETFFDDYMRTELDQKHIPGAVVAVVQGDAVLFTKGYGVANLASRAAIDPANSVFPVASVSKLFTWTAVMQLVEQGKLDLNADVNEYLDYRIPEAFGKPITLFHLMTHTAGFEERNFEARTAVPPGPETLGRWLKTHIPVRVRAPGEATAYSNYGTATAGYIVERVSGESYAAYVENHILRPLGMNDSTFFLPPPPALAAREVTGYSWSSAGYRPGGPNYGSTVPSGGLRSTAADMARFMIAHLQNGRYGSTRILAEGTALRMHERAFGNDPRVNGNAHGFWEMSQNGVRVIGHGGDIDTMHSLVALIPDRQVGLFLSYNSTGGAGRQKPALSAFMDRFYPSEPPAPVDPSAASTIVAGTYHVTRSSQTTVEALLNLVTPVSVRTAPDGSVSLSAPGAAPRYVPVGPMVYRDETGDDRLVFQQDGQGQVARMFLSSDPIEAYTRAAWYELPGLHLALLGGGLLLVLSVVPAALIGLAMRRRRPVIQPAAARAARRVMLAEAGVSVLFLAGLAYVFSNQAAYTMGDVGLARVVLALPLLMLAGALVCAVVAIQAWRRHYWPAWQAGHFSLAVLGLFAMLWVLNFWNAFGWRF